MTSKTHNNFDVCSDDIGADAKRTIKKSAKRAEDEPFDELGATWNRTLDPEGNQFCFALNREN